MAYRWDEQYGPYDHEECVGNARAYGAESGDKENHDQDLEGG
jgi:hypothetical protein